MKILLGVDIGGTKCAVTLALWTDEGENPSRGPGLGNTTEVGKYGFGIKIIDKIMFQTETQRGPGYALDEIVLDIGLILSRNNIAIQEVSGIGISCGGPLDSRRGIIMSPPNLPGWDNIRIVELLNNKFGIKTRLQNDANACALAEWRFGAAKGYNNVVFLTFGTGMGAGLILDGRLYSGTNDMAGEVGHIRLDRYGPVGYGKSGSFEGFCSGGGIAQLARMKVLEKLQAGEKVSFCSGINQMDQINARTVGEAAAAGDELAIEIYSICGHYLGRGLSVIIDILNPELVVIGSIFGRSRELLWPEAHKVIQSECLSYSRNVCKIVPAGLGEKIGDYAAIAIALG